MNEDQPGQESRYQTLDQTGEPGQPAGLFPPGVEGHQSDFEDQRRGKQGSEEQQPVGVNELHDQTILEDQDQDIRNDVKYFQDLAYNCQTQIEQLIIQREEMNRKYECQAKLLAKASQEMSWEELLATQHYTEMLEAQQQKAAAVEEHMLEKATLESKALQQEHELKEEMHQLQLQLTQIESQYAQSLNFPHVLTEQPSESRNLWEEVVGVVPGMVNTKQRAAKYNSTDQPFSSFTRHVHFEDKNKDTSGLSSSLISSTPYKETKRGQAKPVIDLSHIQGLRSVAESSNVAAQAAAEVSLAAVMQTAKEFRRLKDSKILELKGGYSSDVGLVFHSWRTDIQTEINENNYNNKSVIRLIKEKTQEKALKEVEYQLDLNSAEMSYKDLLEHLSLTFMGGKEESTLMADFYSHTQKAKELEESFADELQILAWKVISNQTSNRDSTQY